MSPKVDPTWKLLLKTARPKQWIKNLLVFAAPGAAGVLTRAEPLVDSGITFLAFCLASSSTYMINDVADRESDSRNPFKNHRPLARKQLAPRAALVTAGLLLGLSLVLAWIVSTDVFLILALYNFISISYSLYLKRVRIIDISAVASGFLLRAVIGGVAADVPLSDSFLIVTSFASLVIVTGKRQTEQGIDSPREPIELKPSNLYPKSFLSQLRSIATAVTLTAYSLWAFEISDASSSSVWFKISIIPFVMSVMRYLLLVDTGIQKAPEDILLHDRMLQLLSLTTIVLVAVGIYGS